MESFIYVKENALTAKDCDGIISWFEEAKHLHSPGKVGDHREDHEVKKSTDISIDDRMWVEWDDVLSPLLGALAQGTEEYKKKYTFEGGYGIDFIRDWTITQASNVQRYLPGEGFYEWHCEADGLNIDRVLAWMFYLNTCQNSGTEFKFQNMTTQCKQGSLLIWPANWTHFHRGIVSSTETKYIVTGWFNFV